MTGYSPLAKASKAGRMNGSASQPSCACPPGSIRNDVTRTIYPAIKNIDPSDDSECMAYFENVVILAPHDRSVDDISTRVLDDWTAS